MNSGTRIEARRIAVIMPNWLGDGVMATPFLRALRGVFPKAHIAAAARPLIVPVLRGLPWVDEIREYPRGGDGELRAWLRENKDGKELGKEGGRFELVVLLPNSFRTALSAWRAGVPRRLGYAREVRGWLLTDRLAPEKRSAEQAAADAAKRASIRQLGGKVGPIGSPFQPVPTIDYYLRFAEYLGADITAPAARQMELGITTEERAEADAVWRHLGLGDCRAVRHDVAVLVPGANFGASKCWLPERFAAVARELADPAGPFRARVLIASSPAERPIVDAILRDCGPAAAGGGESVGGAGGGAGSRIVALSHLNGGRGTTLGALKEIVRRSRLMLCNDTGPRHFAAALGVPAVTLFGPTDPRWAETFDPHERTVRIPVPCGPCQLKTCPIDHRCMRGLTAEMVLAAVRQAWAEGFSAAAMG